MGTRCRQGKVRGTNLRLSPDGRRLFAGSGRSRASPLLDAPLDSIAAATLGKREQQGVLLVEMAHFWSKWRTSRIKSAPISSTAVAGAGGPQRLDRLNMPSPYGYRAE
jgi:hypothetical protein